MSKQPVFQYQILNCDAKERFQNYTKPLNFVDITKFACESLEILRPLYVISNGVKNCSKNS